MLPRLALAMALCLPGTALATERLRSRDGVPIHPEAGDIGLGFDAIPVINLALNMVNFMEDTGQQGDGLLNFPEGYREVISARYYLQERRSLRARLALNVAHDLEYSRYNHPADVSNTDVAAGDERKVIDTDRATEVKVRLGLGPEWHRGRGRLQGLYGFEGQVGFESSSSSTDYGWDYNSTAWEVGAIHDGSARTLKESSGVGFVLGARAMLGLEYFFGPKMAVTAEYGFGLGVALGGRSQTRTETWVVTDGAGSAVKDDEDGATTSTGFWTTVDNGLDKDMTGGSGALSLMFHF